MRDLPADLATALRRIREVELAATTRPQWLAAVRATTVLAAAARREGWTTAELAAGLGVQVKALTSRLHQLDGGPSWTGLVVTPPPPTRIAPPLPPPEVREWLTAAEAIKFAASSSSNLSQWLHAGLLPATKPEADGPRRYARTDLQRILDAPRRGRVGVDWSQVRRQIAGRY